MPVHGSYYISFHVSLLLRVNGSSHLFVSPTYHASPDSTGTPNHEQCLTASHAQLTKDVGIRLPHLIRDLPACFMSHIMSAIASTQWHLDTIRSARAIHPSWKSVTPFKTRVVTSYPGVKYKTEDYNHLNTLQHLSFPTKLHYPITY